MLCDSARLARKKDAKPGIPFWECTGLLFVHVGTRSGIKREQFVSLQLFRRALEMKAVGQLGARSGIAIDPERELGHKREVRYPAKGGVSSRRVTRFRMRAASGLGEL